MVDPSLVSHVAKRLRTEPAARVKNDLERAGIPRERVQEALAHSESSPLSKGAAYVKKELDAGHTRDAVRGRLTKGGWTSQQIDEAFASLDAHNAQAHTGDRKNDNTSSGPQQQKPTTPEAAGLKTGPHTSTHLSKGAAYVKKEMDLGHSRKEIKGRLTKAGWTKQQIETAFTSLDAAKKDDTSSALQRYIEHALSIGTPPEVLTKNLVGKGWSNAQVQAAISAQPKQDSVPNPEADERRIRSDPDTMILEEYSFRYMQVDLKVMIYRTKGGATPTYHLVIPVISGTTDLILEEIRLKLIDQITLGTIEISQGDFQKLDKQVQDHLVRLIGEGFSQVGEHTQRFLASYLISKVLGLGIVEIIKADESLEEIVINQSDRPIYIYHKKHGWCATNQYLPNDEQIMHLAQMTGRRVGREITTLAPLLDAHLPNGDRVNATIKPITAAGPTITIRKFSSDPWTITKFLKTKTMDYYTAAIIWLAIQFELSCLVVGGTASGKTSCLNVLTNLIPPDQRIISIEDTREIRLPAYMHWVPMVSRQPNPEGKGAVEMEDLLVNSLRMRPDRIIVGEVRKRVQAETLFEAIHTGHSCYATFHANNAEEAIVRLTNPPVSVPKSMMPAISLLIVQYRNRRSGLRRTFQIAEITKTGDANVLMQYNPRDDTMSKAAESTLLFKNLELYTGNTREEIEQMIAEKIKVLEYLVKHDLKSIEQVGKVMSLYYTENKLLLGDIIPNNKKI